VRRLSQDGVRSEGLQEIKPILPAYLNFFPPASRLTARKNRENVGV
jgi:hypothetical protein